MMEKRPPAIWIAVGWTLVFAILDVVGPVVAYGRAISTSPLYWLQIALLGVGVFGFWRLKWWGPLLVALLAVETYVRSNVRLMAQPDLLTYGLIIGAVATFVYMGPLVLVSLGYRERFSWLW